MGVNVAKDAIDLGIVTTNGNAMLTFYRNVLGFRRELGRVHPGSVGQVAPRLSGNQVRQRTTARLP